MDYAKVIYDTYYSYMYEKYPDWFEDQGPFELLHEEEREAFKLAALEVIREYIKNCPL